MMTPEQETSLQQRVQELLETDDCDSVLRPDGVFQMTAAGEQRWSFFGRLQPVQGQEKEESTVNEHSTI